MLDADLAACNASAHKLARKCGCDWRDLLGLLELGDEVLEEKGDGYPF